MTLFRNLRSFRASVSTVPETVTSSAGRRGNLTAQWVVGHDGLLECRWSLRAKDGEPDLGLATPARLQAA